MKCSVAGCNSVIRGRGLCSKHWQKAKKEGTLPAEWIRLQRRPEPIEQKLEKKKVINAETACWEWGGRLSEDGYGLVPICRSRYASVHRTSFQLAKGPIPQGLELDHLCRNRKCFNPEHLEIVTRKENIRRGILPEMMKAKAAAQTHCKNGHPLSGENLVLQGPEKRFRVCRICRSERQRRKYQSLKQMGKSYEKV